ncbi:MAG: carboxypeptidase-like regulatory domain-containing protein [Flavobacteriales bacterium]|nr:carboxypeptidase-like regulatory domain-containing protein [Flavobacteriales bacterium]
MNLFRTILIVGFGLFNTITLVAQKHITKGVILNKKDSTPVENAHVINVNSNNGIKSNVYGEFTISTKKRDTLLISFIGFKTLKIIEFENLDTFYLEKETFTLESYTVLPYKNFKEFKEAFVKLELKDTVKHKINSSILALVKPFNPNNLNGKFAFSGPFSSLAAMFNKQIKDKKNYDKLVAKDKYKAQLYKKFNPQLIKRVTLLNDSLIVDDFMIYCDFTDKFIELSSQYELFDEIINCFEEYSNLPIVYK